MDEIINLNELKTNQWQAAFKQHEKPVFDYDADLDIMYLYFAPIGKKERIITHNIDRHAALLFRHSDLEIVGMSFEAFQKSFLPSHAGNSWRLVDTGIQLEHIKDIKFVVTKMEAASLKKQASLARTIDRGIELQPVFA